MEERGFYIVGQLDAQLRPIVLHDEHGPVHFYPIPYCDPSVVRERFNDEAIKTHDEAIKAIVKKIEQQKDDVARHVYIGHAFVTPYGREEENTSESEKPLSIGGVEFVNATHFDMFHYTALGHLHRAHHVMNETIRYAGSPLKYSISEENHKKGFYIVQLDHQGEVTIDHKQLTPKRDMRTVRATMDEILRKELSEDYVYVELLDEDVVLQPMEKVRSVYPNAMHVSRKNDPLLKSLIEGDERKDVRKMSDIQLFRSFYEQLTGEDVPEQTEAVFQDVLEDLLTTESETEVIEK